MVSRLGGTALAAALLGLLGACQAAPPDAPPALLLRGFNLVDPASRSVTQRDIVIEGGVVVERAASRHVRRIDGNGRFLLPALWDLKASLWGNNSLLSYDVLTQDTGFTPALELHLFHGVAHVGVFAMQRDWVGRELGRAEALEIAAAEPLYPDVTLCSVSSFACTTVKSPRETEQALDARQRARAPFVVVSFLAAGDSALGGVSAPLLAVALAGARRRALPSLVLVDDWRGAQQAAELGASIVHGFPEGIVPDDVLQTFVRREVAFAPALSQYLEALRLLGSPAARAEPLLRLTVMPEVLDTFASERDAFEEWRPTLQQGRARRADVMQSLGRLVGAGVRLVVTSDAGWMAGAFQGYGSLATQAWLEQAGLDGWTRLSAATLWPARALGRRADFAAGAPADFVALTADPLQSAEHLKRISLVMRGGKVVDRERLLPDLTRSNYAKSR